MGRVWLSSVYAGRSDGAIGDYKKEIALHPDETAVYLPLAAALESNGQIVEAEEQGVLNCHSGVCEFVMLPM